jgi:AcrR family transcriptional regulator
MIGSARATKPQRPRRAARGHEDILRAAAEVVAVRGLEGTRFSDVAERSATSISTLQYLFGSREDLVVAALRQASADLLAAMSGGPSIDGDPVGHLRWVVGQMLGSDADELETANALARADWLLWLEYTRAGARDPQLREESVATFAAWRSLLRDGIQACIDAGAIAPPDDLELVVRATGSMIDGIGVAIVLGHPDASLDVARHTVLTSLGVAIGLPDLADRSAG